MQFSFSAIAHTSRDHGVLGKFHPFDYQATFVAIFFRASRPNTIILMFNRKKLFSSVKKNLLREFPLQTKYPSVIIILRFS